MLYSVRRGLTAIRAGGDHVARPQSRPTRDTSPGKSVKFSRYISERLIGSASYVVSTSECTRLGRPSGLLKWLAHIDPPANHLDLGVWHHDGAPLGYEHLLRISAFCRLDACENTVTKRCARNLWVVFAGSEGVFCITTPRRQHHLRERDEANRCARAVPIRWP